MSAMTDRRCRSPTRRAVRRYAVPIARRHPRLLWGALALHVLAAVAGAGRPAPARRPRRVGRERHHGRPRRQDRCWLLAGFLRRCRRCSPATPATSARCSASRCWPSCARTSSATPSPCRSGVVESAGSGDLLTRTSRDVDQLGWSVRMALPEWTIAVDHRGPDLRRRAQRRLVGRAAVPARRAAAGDRAALVPRPRQGRLPARERVVLRHQRDAHRDRRGRPHRRGARPRRRADRGRSTRTSRRRTPPSATRSTCARCSSRAWSSPT